MTNYQCEQLARAFSSILRDWLSAAEMAAVIQLNKEPDYQYGACATHNYCDANMAMNGAFEQVLGREATINDEDTRLWNEAWNLARSTDFYQQAVIQTVCTVTVTDPDIGGEIELVVYKESGGGMFAVDASYIANTELNLYSPFGNGRLIIP